MAQIKRLYRNPSPETHIIVRTKEGDYLRRKRGTVTKAEVNDAFQEQAGETCSGAAKEIMMRLKPFTEYFYGRIQVYLSGRLRKAYHVNKETDYSLCMHWQVMKHQPLEALYFGRCDVEIKGNTINLIADADGEYITTKNKNATHFYLEAVLVHGDAMITGNLRVESERSELISLTPNWKAKCNFSFVVPADRKYLLFLKAGLMEGNEAAKHQNYYGMNVVAVG